MEPELHVFIIMQYVEDSMPLEDWGKPGKKGPADAGHSGDDAFNLVAMESRCCHIGVP